MNYTCHLIFEESQLELIERLLNNYYVFKKYFPKKARKDIDENLVNELKYIIKSSNELYKEMFKYSLETECKHKTENPSLTKCCDASFNSGVRTNISMNKARCLYDILEMYTLFTFDYSCEDKELFMSLINIYTLGEEIKNIKTKLLERIGAAFVYKTKIEEIE